MRETSGLLLLILALFVGYLAVTGKYACFSRAFRCLAVEGAEDCPCANSEKSTPKSYLDELLELYKNAIPGM